MTESIRNYKKSSLEKLESQLSQLLQPVTPDTDFVNALKTKLTQVPTIVVESTKKGSRFILLGIGIITGIITIWLIDRTNRETRNK